MVESYLFSTNHYWSVKALLTTVLYILVPFRHHGDIKWLLFWQNMFSWNWLVLIWGNSLINNYHHHNSASKVHYYNSASLILITLLPFVLFLLAALCKCCMLQIYYSHHLCWQFTVRRCSVLHSSIIWQMPNILYL